MKTLTVVVLLLALTSCASYRPVIDTRGVDMNSYEADLAQCQQYAKQVAGVGTGAAMGAAGGAVLSYALTRILGGNTNDALKAGALLGGVGGAAQGGQSEMNVIKRCLAGRGYSVLQ